jgi:hypothetical protein
VLENTTVEGESPVVENIYPTLDGVPNPRLLFVFLSQVALSSSIFQYFAALSFIHTLDMHFATLVSFVLVAVATAAPLSPDPAGAKNVGNGQGGQFITGECTSDADCNSGCCATLGNIVICSGVAVADVQGKSGWGFGGAGAGTAKPETPAPDTPAVPTNNQSPAAGAAGGSGLKPDPAGEKNIGNAKGGQFITGQCTSDADCGSTCCATLGDIGICSGPAVANTNGKTGCGFTGSAPAKPQTSAAPTNNQGAGAAGGSGLKPDPAGEKNIGNAKGGQFITGQCTSDADCGSTCCATLGDIGICSGPAVANTNGKTGCGFGSNKRSLGGVFGSFQRERS